MPGHQEHPRLSGLRADRRRFGEVEGHEVPDGLLAGSGRAAAGEPATEFAETAEPGDQRPAPGWIKDEGAGAKNEDENVITAPGVITGAGVATAGPRELSWTAARLAPTPSSTHTPATTITRRVLPPIIRVRRGLSSDISMMSPSSGPDLVMSKY
jgi:hypothetical protein